MGLRKVGREVETRAYRCDNGIGCANCKGRGKFKECGAWIATTKAIWHRNHETGNTATQLQDKGEEEARCRGNRAGSAKSCSQTALTLVSSVTFRTCCCKSAKEGWLLPARRHPRRSHASLHELTSLSGDRHPARDRECVTHGLPDPAVEGCPVMEEACVGGVEAVPARGGACPPKERAAGSSGTAAHFMRKRSMRKGRERRRCERPRAPGGLADLTAMADEARAKARTGTSDRGQVRQELAAGLQAVDRTLRSTSLATASSVWVKCLSWRSIAAGRSRAMTACMISSCSLLKS